MKKELLRTKDTIVSAYISSDEVFLVIETIYEEDGREQIADGMEIELSDFQAKAFGQALSEAGELASRMPVGN